MQLQKLVYIAHGWNLAINGGPLTIDNPEAWEYGPVYPELRRALRSYGRSPVGKEIVKRDTVNFGDDRNEPMVAELDDGESAVVERVFRDYGKFHAFQLSALTHRDGTPWTKIYDSGLGKYDQIPDTMIREHFIDLARAGKATAHA